MKLAVKFFAFIILSLSSICFAQDDKTKVLVIHSTNHDSKETMQFISGIDSAFRASALQYELINRFLDAKRFPLSGNASDKLVEYYRSAFENHKPNVIIACGDEALLFTLRCRENAFAGIPVIFCGISENLESRIPKKSGITGLFYDSMLFENIELILKLFPDTKNIAFVHDQTEESIAQAADAEKLMTRFSKVSFYFISKLPDERIKRAISTLPPNTVVFLLSYNLSQSGEYYTDEQTANFVSLNTKQPVFSFIPSYLNNGIFGGYTIDDFAHGRQAGEMALEILRGTDPNVYAYQRSPKSKYIFDNKYLIKFTIDKTKLPAGYEIINQEKPKPVLTSKNFHVISAVVFLLLLGATIYLAFNRKRK